MAKKFVNIFVAVLVLSSCACSNRAELNDRSTATVRLICETPEGAKVYRIVPEHGYGSFSVVVYKDSVAAVR